MSEQKVVKKAWFKVLIETLDNGRIKANQYNSRLPFPLQAALFDAVMEVVNKVNGENTWKERFTHFFYHGVNFKQVPGTPCKDCIFHGKENSMSLGCSHPYFKTKDKCENKVYVIDEPPVTELKKTAEYIKLMQHCIGLKPGSRIVKGRYTAYRNYFSTERNNKSWSEICSQGYAEYSLQGTEATYYLTPLGYKYLEDIMNIKITEDI